jgi:DNA-binding transcriptional regulator YiaG
MRSHKHKTARPEQDELRPEYKRSDFGVLVRGKYADGPGHGSDSDVPELTDKQFARALPARVRRRLMQGQIESGEDVAALRRFVGLTQVQFARAMGISVHTLRNWEQGRRHPEGPAIALLRIAARNPRILPQAVTRQGRKPPGRHC